MTDKTDSKEREALRSIGEEQAFEAWFKVDCPVGGANAKIAAKAAWKARASIDPSGFDAADMATASAQGFRDGVASLAASAGSEPVPFGHWFTDDPKAFATPGSGFLVGKEPPKNAINVIPLYTHPSPPEGMVGGWQDIATAPAAGLILLAVEDSEGERRVFPAEASHQHGCVVWMVTVGWLGWTRLHSAWTPILWRRLTPPPTTSAGSGKGE